MGSATSIFFFFWDTSIEWNLISFFKKKKYIYIYIYMRVGHDSWHDVKRDATYVKIGRSV